MCIHILQTSHYTKVTGQSGLFGVYKMDLPTLAV